MRILVVVLGFLLVACGSDPSDPVEQPDTSRTVTVGLSGVGAPGAVLIGVEDLRLRIDGEPVSVDGVSGELDLGDDAHVWPLLEFDLPLSSALLELRLYLASEGVATTAQDERLLHLGSPPIGVVMDAGEIGSADMIVIEIDLARSLVERDGELHLVPNLVVLY